VHEIEMIMSKSLLCRAGYVEPVLDASHSEWSPAGAVTLKAEQDSLTLMSAIALLKDTLLHETEPFATGRNKSGHSCESTRSRFIRYPS
jgi:hypothetical protein